MVIIFFIRMIMPRLLNELAKAMVMGTKEANHLLP